MARASLDRIDAVVEGRDVDQVQQQPRALQVAQELVAEAGAFGRAFDQAGNVGDHEALLGRDAHHAEVRVQRGERIVGDLRPRGRDRARSACDLPALGMPSRPTSASTRSSSLSFALLARPAGRELARRAVGAGLEVQVAEAAVAALARAARAGPGRSRSAITLAGLGVADDGAHRHAQHDVLAGRAVLVRAAARSRRSSALVAARVAVVDQRVEVAVGDAHRCCRRARRRRRRGRRSGMNFSRRKLAQPSPPLPACDVDRGFVENSWRVDGQKQKSPGDPGLSRGVGVSGSGRADAHGLLVARALDREVTPCPSTSANSVWSRPMPTLVPAWNLVPRWRTMIEPAGTIWPPIDLDAEHLGLRIAAVARRAAAFFLCHGSGLL